MLGLALEQEDLVEGLVEEPPLFGDCSLVFQEEELDVVEYGDLLEEDVVSADQVVDDSGQVQQEGFAAVEEVAECRSLVGSDVLQDSRQGQEEIVVAEVLRPVQEDIQVSDSLLLVQEEIGMVESLQLVQEDIELLECLHPLEEDVEGGPNLEQFGRVHRGKQAH